MSFHILHPRELEAIRKEKKAMVVDLRERSEYLKYHYRYAVNMPYEENECWLEGFNRHTVYILYCEHGSISLLAARKLGRRGIEVYTIVGGAEGMYRYR